MNEEVEKLKEIRRVIDGAIDYLESGSRMVESESQLPRNVMIVGGWLIAPASEYMIVPSTGWKKLC